MIKMIPFRKLRDKKPQKKNTNKTRKLTIYAKKHNIHNSINNSKNKSIKNNDNRINKRTLQQITTNKFSSLAPHSSHSIV